MAKNIGMKNCKALIIGGSAGSLEVLTKVLPRLNQNLSIAIIIVLHRKPGADQLLTDVLSAKTRIPVSEIEEKQLIVPGNIYLAPSDYHLLVEKDYTFSLDHSEPVNYSRPSIDVSFQSAAEVFKDSLTAILLSGANADGVAGMKKVKIFGGITAIQDPECAAVSYMPAQAAIHVPIDEKLLVEEMASFINDL